MKRILLSMMVFMVLAASVSAQRLRIEEQKHNDKYKSGEGGKVHPRPLSVKKKTLNRHHQL
jgi:hypothetical protein